MLEVKACPKNQLEIDKATERLKCGVDSYGNNQYMCLPNEQKTSLVEFCYKGIMGIEDKGKTIRFYIFPLQMLNYNIQGSILTWKKCSS